MGALVLKTAPAVEPVLLAEGKDHLRVDITDDDALITGLLLAAKNEVERLTSRRLITQTWTWTLDRFPAHRKILRLPLAPVSSVTSVKVTDRNGVQTTFAASNYIEDTASEPARIVLKDGVIFPEPADQLQEANGVEIEFVVGYGLAGSDVPEEIKVAQKMTTAHLYENRESTIAMALRDLPQGVFALLAQHQAWNMFGSVRVHSDLDEEPHHFRGFHA